MEKVKNIRESNGRVCDTVDTTSGVETLLLGDKQIFMYKVPNSEGIYHCFDVDEVDYIVETGKDPWNKQEISAETLYELRLWKAKVPKKLGSRSLSEIFLDEQTPQAHFTDEQVKVNVIAEEVNKEDPYPDVNAFFDLPFDKLKFFSDYYGLNASDRKQLIDKTFKMVNRNKQRNRNYRSFLMNLGGVMRNLTYMVKDDLTYDELKDDLESRDEQLFLDMNNKQLNAMMDDDTDYYISVERMEDIASMNIREVDDFIKLFFEKVDWVHVYGHLLVQVDRNNYVMDISYLRNVIFAIERHHNLELGPGGKGDLLFRVIDRVIPKDDIRKVGVLQILTSYFINEKRDIGEILFVVLATKYSSLSSGALVEFAINVNDIVLFRAAVGYGFIVDLSGLRFAIIGRKLSFIRATLDKQKDSIVEQIINTNPHAVKFLSPVDIAREMRDEELEMYLRSFGLVSYNEYQEEAKRQAMVRESMFYD